MIIKGTVNSIFTVLFITGKLFHSDDCILSANEIYSKYENIYICYDNRM